MSVNTLQTLRDLIALGVPAVIVERWIADFNLQGADAELDYPLTPFQRFVLEDSEVLQGHKNLVIGGTTSSGKTLVAQVMSAITLAQRPNARILYLVPLRALVTEKTRQFNVIFSQDDSHGENSIVLPLSSDYPASDGRIGFGDWRVGVAVFDKLYHWMADREHLYTILADVDLIVIDEIQILEAQERGERLELVLAFLRWLQSRDLDGIALRARATYRIVAMVSSPFIAETLKNWLDAIVVPSSIVERPVALYEGWITPRNGHKIYGTVEADNVLSCETYPASLRKIFHKLPETKSRNNLLIELVHRFVAQKRRVLVYVATKGEARELAAILSRRLCEYFHWATIHPDLIEPLSQLEESPVRDGLERVLVGRVGFHHGDMTPAERQIVEDSFRRSQPEAAIYVVIATPTLSMGINLSTDVVLMRDYHTYGLSGWDYDDDGVEYRDTRERLLTVLEYQNFAGRAGRYHAHLRSDAYGLCLVLCEKENVSVVEGIIRGQVRPLISQLNEPRFGFDPHVLTILSAVSAVYDYGGFTEEKALEIFNYSYIWRNTPAAHGSLRSGVRLAFENLRDQYILQDDGLSAVGVIAARHHLCYSSLRMMLKLARDLGALWPSCRLELIYELANAAEFSSEYPNLSYIPEDKGRRTKLEESLRRFLREYVPARQYRVDSDLYAFIHGIQGQKKLLTRSGFQRMIRTALLWGWSEGHPIDILTKTHAFPKLGGIRPIKSLAERMAHMLSALRQIWERLHLEDDDSGKSHLSYERTSQHMWLFQKSLNYGVPISVVPLPVVVEHAFEERGLLTRTTYMKIWRSVGEWSDARDLIGKESPLPDQRMWERIQRALDWWLREAERLRETAPDEIGLMLPALKGLAQGDYDDLPSLTNNSWLQDVGLDLDIYQTILEFAKAHTQESHSLGLEGVERVAVSVFTRLRGQIIHVTKTYLSTREWRKFYLKGETVFVRLVGDALSTQTLQDLKSQYIPGRLVVVSSHPFNSHLYSHFFPRDCLAVDIESLLAAAEFVYRYPKHRQNLIDVLLHKEANLTCPDDLIGVMFSHNNSQ